MWERLLPACRNLPLDQRPQQRTSPRRTNIPWNPARKAPKTTIGHFARRAYPNGVVMRDQVTLAAPVTASSRPRAPTRRRAEGARQRRSRSPWPSGTRPRRTGGASRIRTHRCSHRDSSAPPLGHPDSARRVERSPVVSRQCRVHAGPLVVVAHGVACWWWGRALATGSSQARAWPLFPTRNPAPAWSGPS